MDIEQRINDLYKGLSKIVTPDTAFICIGARKHVSILDSIGPRVGDRLKQAGIPFVYGTNDDPYNGLTYRSMNERINRELPKGTTTIAIDLCCTKNEEKINKIELSKSPIHPGAGAGKNMPAVGNYAIRAFAIGIEEADLVNDFVLRGHFLFKEKLDLVYEMTNIISTAIIKAYENSLALSLFDQVEINSKKNNITYLI